MAKNVLGMGLPNGPGPIDDALDLGFQSYLVIDGAHAFDQIVRIRERQRDARIYLRRPGGIGGDPEDVADECGALLDYYGPWGVVDIIGWNEPDRVEEDGFTSRQIADFAAAYLPILRQHAPHARIHWPALAHVERYQDPEQWIWLPVAREFDVIDIHAYHNPGNAVAFFRWCETRLPGKPIALTEYNWGPGNARPIDYGDWLYEVYRQAAVNFPQVEAVLPFIWEWVHPEPGIGTTLDIRHDPDALAGIRRASVDFGRIVGPVPQPAPLEPIPTDWAERNANLDQKRYQRNWLDDGDDCLSSSFAEALRLNYGEGLPDVPEMEAAYRRYHPDWPDTASTMRLADYWRALADLGITVVALHERGDLIDQFAAELAQGRVPCAWVYLPDGAGGYFHHALVVTGYSDGRLTFWDQQVGIVRECSIEEFTTPGSRLASSGYGYAAYWQPVEERPVASPPDGIVWIPSPNFARGRGGRRPAAIVDHIMEGTLAACDSWFSNPASQVSAHFGIGRNGAIHQYVSSSDTAWGNGRVNRPDLSIGWLADAVRRGINPNAITVSIEHEGKSGDTLTEAQYQASLALHRYLCARWGIPTTADRIVGHNRIDSVDRARCPGSGFPFSRILDDLNFAEPAPTVVTPEVALGEIFRVAGLIAGKHPDVLPEVQTIHRMVAVIKDG